MAEIGNQTTPETENGSDASAITTTVANGEVSTTTATTTTAVNTRQMSPSAVEQHLDYHLSTVVMQYNLHHLVGFLHSLDALPVEARIAEKLLEVIRTTEDLFDRRLSAIGQRVRTLLRGVQMLTTTNKDPSKSRKDLLEPVWSDFRETASLVERTIDQVTTTSKHLRCVARVYSVPVEYRSLVNTEAEEEEEEGEPVRLRKRLKRTVRDSAEVCRMLCHYRNHLDDELKAILTVAMGRAPKPDSGPREPELTSAVVDEARSPPPKVTVDVPAQEQSLDTVSPMTATTLHNNH